MDLAPVAHFGAGGSALARAAPACPAAFLPFPAPFAGHCGATLRRAPDWGKGWPLIAGGKGQACFWSPAGPALSGRTWSPASTRPGATDVVVNDLLGPRRAKWRNLAKRQLADLVPPAELTALARRPQARRRHPYGRDLRHHRHRRRPGDGEQFPPVAAPARLVHGERARPSSMRPRRRPMAMARRVSTTTGRPRRCASSSR